MKKSDTVEALLSNPESWQLSNRQIARLCQVDEGTVRKVKAKIKSPHCADLLPRTYLQTLSLLNPKTALFDIQGETFQGTIAAVLVDWSTAAVKAVLINWSQGQIQIPIAQVRIVDETLH